MNPAQRKPYITVFGGGSWGTTVASICSQKTPTVQWVRSSQTANEINHYHTNSRYLGDKVQLSPSLQATTDFVQAAQKADIVVMGVPSHGFRSVLEMLAPELRPWVPVISLTKGLEKGTNLRMTQVIEEVLPMHPAGALSGPNIAQEIAEGHFAAAVLAIRNQHIASQLAQLFCSPTFRVYTTEDIIGVEIAGALKNIYAIASGMGHALQMGENAHAMLIARSLREMVNLGQAMGGMGDTFAGLAGVGDLTVTCTSSRSRNHYVGQQLGFGKNISEITSSMDQVAEGVRTVGTILQLAEQYNVNMPIASMVDQVVNHGLTPQVGYQLLVNDPPSHEIHGTGF